MEELKKGTAISNTLNLFPGFQRLTLEVCISLCFVHLDSLQRSNAKFFLLVHRLRF